MVEHESDTLTPKDLVILLQDGHPKVNSNISKMALEYTVDDWEDHDDKDDKLEVLRESSFKTDAFTPTEGTVPDTDGYVLVPSKTPDKVSGFHPPRLISIAREFAQEFYDNYCDLYRELFESSSLTKKQFLVYLMKEGQTNEEIISGALDIEIGTVRSHAARARKKVEEAQNTARIPELFTVSDRESAWNEMMDMMEPQST